MKNQQQAEKEEQQRIKNLVLNYDLQQNEDQQEGRQKNSPTSFFTITNMIITYQFVVNERQTFHHNRVEKPGKDRGQRVRKLQLSDVDW